MTLFLYFAVVLQMKKSPDESGPGLPGLFFSCSVSDFLSVGSLGMPLLDLSCEIKTSNI